MRLKKYFYSAVMADYKGPGFVACIAKWRVCKMIVTALPARLIKKIILISQKLKKKTKQVLVRWKFIWKSSLQYKILTMTWHNTIEIQNTSKNENLNKFLKLLKFILICESISYSIWLEFLIPLFQQFLQIQF